MLMIRAIRPRHRPFSATAFALRPLSSPAPRPLATPPPAALSSLELLASPYQPMPSSVEVTSSNSVRAEEPTSDKPTAAVAEQEEVQALASLSHADDPTPSPTPEGPLSFVAEKIRDSESRDAAQLKIESWAKEWYMVQEQAKVERRSTEKQASPSAYAHVSTDSGFTKFVWDWTQALEERFRRNGTRGMSKRTQELLNVSVFNHQVFSDEDLARLTVSVLVELLVQVVSNPNLSLSHSNKRRRDPDAADDESPTTFSDPKDLLSHQPFDVLLMRAAKEIGEHVRDEYGRRTMGSPMAATASPEQAQTPRAKRRRSAPRPGSSQQATEIKDLVYSMEDVVQVGGDLLYLSQDVNVYLPTSETPSKPWTKAHVQTEKTSGGFGKCPAVLRFDPQLLALASVVDDIRIGHRDLPMIVPPLPVTRTEDGGYLQIHREFLNARTSLAREAAVSAARLSGDMDRMIQALNFLSNTPWRVSSDLLADFVRLWPDTSTPLRSAPPSLQELRKGLPLQREDKTCIDIARAFESEYFFNAVRPDYRGRIYPATTELSTVSNDLTRSLLRFDVKKKLGPDGLTNLKLHLASLYGATKRESFQGRIDWVDSHMDDILDSGRNGLDGRRWFATGDHTWQVRGTCLEIARALEHPEGPQEFESDLPVHQDGSCNGLQHYGALARDAEGGAAVNLLPSIVPSDVYSKVLDKVISHVEARVATQLEARWIWEHRDQTLVRDAVKRTVMTRVYGLTTEGARRHAQEFLEKIDAYKQRSKGTVPRNLPVWFSEVVVESIAGLFPRATAIQRWLGTCCDIVLRSRRMDVTGEGAVRNITMSWTTPLGFPVIQDQRRIGSRNVMSQAGRIAIMDPRDSAQVIISKEKNAFAPNFIHSLDATHLYQTALECEARGITMGSVHDSFWTHACDVEILRQVTRSTFVDLYSTDVLENLREELLEKYGDNQVSKSHLRLLRKSHRLHMETQMGFADAQDEPDDAWTQWGRTKGKDNNVRTNLPPCPPKGDLDITNVLRSDFFFH